MLAKAALYMHGAFEDVRGAQIDVAHHQTLTPSVGGPSSSLVPQI